MRNGHATTATVNAGRDADTAPIQDETLFMTSPTQIANVKLRAPDSATPTGAEKPAPHQPSPFAVARVERTGAPDGAIGQNWYRYVLDNGRSHIVGQRCGSLKDVTAYAQQYAEQLNSRNGGASSTWTSRTKK